ncbi:hypothetical protein ACFVAD_01575 [Sutcliffiella sp. NPDC057660]|uniref:hypothetical protein n=1 Tax=Sutcliffiella sp. NPDC057660 TaxID=3346199 RepID=UPI0036B75D36
MLIIDKSFVPCPVEEGDEICQIGIMRWNITKLLEFASRNREVVQSKMIRVADEDTFTRINEAHVSTVDLSKPIILLLKPVITICIYLNFELKIS